MKDAERRSVCPRDGRGARGARENRVSQWVFLVSVNLFLGEKREDLESVGSVGVDVAGVLDRSGAGDVAGEEEARNADTVDVATADGLPGDFGVEYVGDGVFRLDINTFLDDGLIIGGDVDDGVLAAGRSVLRNVDVELDDFCVVGIDQAGAVDDGNPIDDLVVVAVVFVEDLVVVINGEGNDVGFIGEGVDI